MSAAIDAPASWVLYGATAGDIVTVETSERSTADARKVLDVVSRLAPAVEVVEQMAEEIARLKIPIPGGHRMSIAMGQASVRLARADAVTSHDPNQ